MHITVLGGTSFIGPYVVRRLAAHGHDVTVVHRGEHERDDLGDSVRHVHTDRARLAEMMDEVGDADVALDMLAMTEASARSALDALRGHIGRLVVISSVDVYRAYGALTGIEESPLPEPPLDEDAPLRTVLHPFRGQEGVPPWLQDYDKIPVERLALSDNEIAGTALRLGAVYGPGDGQHRLLQTVARIDDARPAILLEGTQAASLWPHVYVEDVAAAIALAVTDERAAGRVYNVGPQRTVGLGDWTRSVGDALGWTGEVVIVPDGTIEESSGADLRHGLDLRTERIRAELGFSEVVSQAEGIARTAEWEREFRRSSGTGPSADDYAREDAILASLQRT